MTLEKAYLRHIRTSAYCCFLPDLTRFTVSYCAGPRPCQTKLSRDKLCTYYIYFSAGCQLFYTITRTTALKPLTSEHCIYHTNRPHGPGAGLPRFFAACGFTIILVTNIFSGFYFFSVPDKKSYLCAATNVYSPFISLKRSDQHGFPNKRREKC